MGEDDTVVVPRERMIMASGRTESGARDGSMVGGTMASGNSARVDVRRSEEWMRRRAEGVMVEVVVAGKAAVMLWESIALRL
jgi:hypothetical protein